MIKNGEKREFFSFLKKPWVVIIIVIIINYTWDYEIRSSGGRKSSWAPRPTGSRADGGRNRSRGGIALSRRPRRIRTSRPAAVAAHAAQRARRRFGTPCILLYSIPAPPLGETKNGGLSAPENRRRAPRCIQEIFQYPETNTNGTGKRRAGRLTCSHLVRRLKTNEFHP